MGSRKGVATREGGVDRNIDDIKSLGSVDVATREGGVDRNDFTARDRDGKLKSPPARVAWIETPLRNLKNKAKESPPARVAWIETTSC